MNLTNADVPLIDFSKVRKKRPKKKVDEFEDIEVEIDKAKGAKKAKNTETSNNSQSSAYTYEFLLERVSNLIKKKNPSLTEKSKATLKHPIVNKQGTTRVAWTNFVDNCNSLNRDKDHLQQFILSELGTEGSLGQENQLIIKGGKWNNKHIENLLAKYIKEYVTCQMCKNPSTTLVKDNTTRLQIMQCNTCGSTRSVASIKTGFKGR